MSVFVDTSAFYAAVDDDDSLSDRARKLLLRDEPLVTTDHVLVETWLLLQRRLGGAVADRFWAATVRAGAVVVEQVTPPDLEAAWAIGERFADQSFSIVDRGSFAVMERLGVNRAVTFDDDFAVYRFGHRGDRAFEVIR